MAAHRGCVLLGLCFLLTTPAFSIDLTRANRLKRQVQDFQDAIGDDGPKLPKFSKDEFEDRLKDLLERDRPDLPDVPDNPLERDDDRRGFGSLFDRLEDLSDRLPDDLDDFNFNSFINRLVKPGPKQAVQNNQCWRNPVRIRSFLSDVGEAMRELREELLENVRDAISRDVDTADTPADVADTISDVLDDTVGNDDTSLGGVALDDVSDGDDTGLGGITDNDDAGFPIDEAQAAPAVQGGASSDSMDDDRDDFDMEDLFEKLSEDSVECMSAFLDDADEKMLCRQFAHQSTRVFTMFIQSGVDCSEYLDDDDDLDEAHQRALLNRMLQKPLATWTSLDLQQAIRLAPGVIDDDFLRDFPDDLLDDNLDLLGRVAARSGSNRGLQIALRQRILNKDLDDLDSTAISRLGKGLLSLTEDELDDLDPVALLNANLDDLFDDDDDDDDSSEDRDDDDDDDDVDDDDIQARRLAIGHRMKVAQLSGRQQVARVARFLYDDLDFLETVDADDLFDAAEDLFDLDIDDDDAANLFRRMSQSSRFPPLNQFTRQQLHSMRGVLPGMSLSQLQQLPRATLREAMEDLRDVAFGESQARELLEELFDDDLSKLTVQDLRGLGQLARGLAADDIEDMDDNVITEVLDDIDDLDLNDAQKRLIADKALKAQSAQGALKLLRLPGFAGAISVDDIDDLNDDDVVSTLNVTRRIGWRASQAVTIMTKVKHTLRGRSLRPGDIPNLGKLARGLLPRDLDDMVDRPEDVDDLADVLGDHEDELSSSMIENMLDMIEDKDDFDEVPEIKATAEFVAQKGIFLAYLPPGQFKKLEFDDGGKKAFVALMSRMDTRKLPRAQLKFLAEEILDMMDDRLETETDDDADFRKLRELGQFSLGLTEDRIEKMSAIAIKNNLAVLGTLPLTRDQSEAILDKLEEALPEWECDSIVLANAGPLLQFARKDIIDKICDKELTSSMSLIEKRLEKHMERVEERREEGLWREDSLEAPDTPDFLDTPDTPDVPDMLDDATEDDAGRKILVTRMLTAALATRGTATNVVGRRRRAAAGELTCSVLRLMRQDVVMVEVGRITALPNAEFSDCLEVLGNATKWDGKDLSTLLQKATEVLGLPSSWSNEIIRQAGVIVSALTPVEIQALRLTGVDALNSVAKHARMDREQLKAGFSQWLGLKKNSNILAVTPGEFASMSEFVCGLTISQIGQLPLEVFKRSLDVIGRAKSCSVEQRIAYANLATTAYGDIVLNWSPAVVGDMGHVIGGLTAPSVQQLTRDQLALVRPTVMAHLPVSTLKAMTEAQLKQLSSNQVNALTVAHYDALNPQQQKALDSKATISFQQAADGSGHGNTTEAYTVSSTESIVAASTPETKIITVLDTTAMPPKPEKTLPDATTESTTKMAEPVTPEKVSDYHKTLPTEGPKVPETTAKTAMTPIDVSYEVTTESVVKVETTAVVMTEKPVTTYPKISDTATTRYVQSSTRKSIPVTTQTQNDDFTTGFSATSRHSIRPDTTRGDEPWVKFTSKDPGPYTTKPGSPSIGENANNVGENTVLEATTPSRTGHDQKTAGHGSNDSGSGAASAVSWNMASLLVTLLFAFLLC